MIKINPINIGLGIEISVKTFLLACVFSVFILFVINGVLKVTMRYVAIASHQSDLDQFQQLQTTALNNQLKLLESLTLLSPIQSTSKTKSLTKTIEAHWNTISLLNDIQALTIFENNATKAGSFGHNPNLPSKDIIEQVIKSEEPNDLLLCQLNCDYLVVSPLIFNNAFDYTAVVSMPIEYLLNDMSKITGTNIALINSDNSIKAKSIYDISEIELASTISSLGNTEHKLSNYVKVSSIAEKNISLGVSTLPLSSNNNPYRLIIIRDVTNNIQYAESMFYKVTGILLAGIIVLSLSVMFITHSFTRRIHKLSEILPLLSSNNFTEIKQQVSETVQKKSYTVNEIDVLEDTVALVSHRLEKMTLEIQERNKELHKMAYRDTLTDLPNRQSFYESLDSTLKLMSRNKKSTGLLFIDIDDFKHINDTYGHNAGDYILQMLSKRTLHSLRKTDFVYRLAGDEFIILLTDLKSPKEMEVIANKVIKNFSDPIIFENDTITTSISIGGAMTSNDAMTADLFIAHADEAMYKSKRKGKGRYSFYGEM